MSSNIACGLQDIFHSLFLFPSLSLSVNEMSIANKMRKMCVCVCVCERVGVCVCVFMDYEKEKKADWRVKRNIITDVPFQEATRMKNCCCSFFSVSFVKGL